MATDNSYQAIILGDPTSTFVLSKKMIKDIFSSHPKIQSEGNRNRWMFSINENNSKYSLVLGANSKHDITEQLNNWNIIPELGNSKSHLSFVRLQRFLLSEMQMQANYQPIMLKTLLENGGRASRSHIAQEIKEFNSDKEREDFRYVPVYEVLEKHKIVRKENDQFVMDISKITGEEKDQLIALCKWKIPNSPLNLEELIEAFDRNMNLFDPDGYDPSGRKQEHEMFVTRFPLENIPQMQIDEYAAGKLDPQTGRANRSTFCYLLEFGLPSFGGIGGRSANKFGIYYSNSAHAYVYDKKYPSPEEAFDHIKNEINTLLTAAKQFHSDKDWKKFSSSVEEGDYDLFRNVRSKIVTVYFPDEFLNFHIPDLIDEALLAFDAKKMNLDSLYLKEERLLQLKNYHHIMRRWNNGQFSHFIWRAIIKRDNKMDDNFITDAEMETTEINEQPRIFVTGYSKANLVHSIEKSVLGWRSQSQLLSKGDYVYVYDKSSHMLQAAFLILEKSENRDPIWEEELDSNTNTQEIVYPNRWNAELLCDNLQISLGTIGKIEPFNGNPQNKFVPLIGNNSPTPLYNERYSDFNKFLLEKCGGMNRINLVKNAAKYYASSTSTRVQEKEIRKRVLERSPWERIPFWKKRGELQKNSTWL